MEMETLKTDMKIEFVKAVVAPPDEAPAKDAKFEAPFFDITAFERSSGPKRDS